MYLQYIDEFINAVSSKEESLSGAETLELENKASSILKGFISGRLEVFDHGTYNMEFVVLAPSVYSVDYPSTVYFDTFFQKKVALRMVYSYIHKEYDIINSPEGSMPDMANYLDYITPQIIDSLELFHDFFSRDEQGQEMILYRIRSHKELYSEKGISRAIEGLFTVEEELSYIASMLQHLKSDENLRLYYGSGRDMMEADITRMLAEKSAVKSMLKMKSQFQQEFQNENAYPEIFLKNGFRLFDYLMKNHLSSGKGYQSDIAFFYRRMVHDNFIHAKQQSFKDFLEKAYPEIEPMGKLKLLIDVSSERREQIYSSSKLSIGLK